MTEAAPGLHPGVVFGDPLLDDFRNFLHSGFTALVGDDPTRIQYDIADFVWRGPGRFRMAEALRGEGKSLITSFLVPWLIYRDHAATGGRPTINIMVVSGTKDRADNFSHFVREVFYHLAPLRPMIPDDPKRWSSISFDVAGAVPQHAPTVTSRGVFGRLTGDRADVIVFDDIEIPQNAETQGQRTKLHRRAAEFLDVLKPGGEIVGLGTPQIEDTVYRQIAKWGFSIRKWPARYPGAKWMREHGSLLAPLLVRDMEQGRAREGDPVDPQRFSNEELAIKAQGGRSRFALQYMLDTSFADADRCPLRLSDLIVTDCSPEAGPSNPVWSGSPGNVRQDLPNVGLLGDALHGPVPIESPRFDPYDAKVMALDPSGRGKDETGVAVLGAIGANLYLLRSAGYIGGYDDQAMASIVADVRRYGPQAIVYEDNFGDGMFGLLLGRKLREAKLEVGLEGVRHLTQKEARIIDALEPVMNQHRLIVDPQVVADDRPQPGDGGETYRLLHQLTRIERARGCLVHDDRLEALAMGVTWLKARMALDQAQVLAGRDQAEERARWAQWWDEVLDGGPSGPQGPTLFSQKRSHVR